MIDPMLACQIKWEDIDRKAKGFAMELKLDGVRCVVDKRGPVVSLYTRTGNDLTEKLPQLAEHFSNYAEHFTLDGEIGYLIHEDRYPVIDFNKTMRVIGSGVDEAINKQFCNTGQIQFVAFDLLVDKGNYIGDEPEGFRRVHLGMFAASHFDPSLTRLVARWPIWDEQIYKDYVLQGGEGVILKNPNRPYYPGKRPAGVWYKVKKFATVDARITGFTQGQGKYEGMIGAITFETEDGDIGKCSGMEDGFRYILTQSPDHYVGKWMEIRHFGRVGKNGDGLRYPQFLRLRPDRDSTI